MNQKPTISIIMGICNCASTLGEAIESIIHHTYTDWELIMCGNESEYNISLVRHDFPKSSQFHYNRYIPTTIAV